MSDKNVGLKIIVSREGRVVAEAIYNSFPVIFGRTDECNLVLKDHVFISRMHGSIAVKNDHIIVTDLNSLNGIIFEESKKQQFEMGSNGSFQVKSLKFDVQLVLLTEPETQASDIDQKTQFDTLTEKLIEVEPVMASAKPLGELKFEKEGSSQLEKFTFDRIDISTLPDPRASRLPLSHLNFEGLILWHKEVYDVRTFRDGDPILIGPNIEEPLYVPIAQRELNLGLFDHRGAQFEIPKNFSWSVYREGQQLSFEQLRAANEVVTNGSKYKLVLGLNEVISIDIGFNMNIRLRYVPQPRPFVRRTWIENRDEFKRAISMSLLIHAVLCLIAIIVAPKSHGPVVKDVPERFAKLLVEPPKQTFAFEPPAPPPPPPPPPKEEPPPPPKEEPKVQEKPKPKIEKKPVIEKAIVKAKPIVKVTTPSPKRVDETQKETVIEKPAPAEKSAADQMANLFNSMPTPGGGKGPGIKDTQINIQKGSVGSQKSAVKVSGLANASGSGSSSAIESGLGLGAQAGMTGYAKGGGSNTGKRGVVGAVMGTPSFSGSQSTQGLSNAEVMKIVNKYLADIHRCYERALFNDSNIIGRVEYEWEISASGDVTSVSVKRSEVSNGDFLNSCVMGVFHKMKFPSAKNGQSTTANIGFPFGKN